MSVAPPALADRVIAHRESIADDLNTPLQAPTKEADSDRLYLGAVHDVSHRGQLAYPEHVH